MMIKRMVCALCAVMLSLSLCACGEKTKSIDMQALENSMVSADKSLPEMKVSGSWDENAEKAFSYISDLEYNKTHGFFLAYAADGMAYEIAVVQLKDKSDASAMADSLREHVQSRVQMYKTYEPQQVQRAESAVVKTDGDCVLLIMSDAPQNAETAFKEFTK
jgi:Spy/CpxP family protein refolding chaperone